jgi:hypothetical protein
LQSRRGFPDNPITTDGGSGFVNAKIEGSIAEGRALLAAGRPGDAALVFERVLLLSPDDAAARAGLDDARRALDERARALDERLSEAATRIEAGAHGDARALIDAVVREGGDRGRAAALLDRIPVPSRWFARRPPSPDASELEAPPPVISGRSRAVLGSACAVAFAALGIAVSSNWDGLMRHLTQAPVPRDAGAAISSLPAARAEDQTIATALRLIDDGDPARAVALLDSVSPDQPAYPFARQLRGHAERALRQGATRTGALAR